MVEELPSYTAVMTSVPAGKVFVLNVAAPLVSDFFPSKVEPFRNFIIPVGVGPEEETVAVNTTS